MRTQERPFKNRFQIPTELLPIKFMERRGGRDSRSQAGETKFGKERVQTVGPPTCWTSRYRVLLCPLLSAQKCFKNNWICCNARRNILHLRANHAHKAEGINSFWVVRLPAGLVLQPEHPIVTSTRSLARSFASCAARSDVSRYLLEFSITSALMRRTTVGDHTMFVSE